MRGLFQSERVNMLRMSEINTVDHQSMQYLLTDSCADWKGFGEQIAKETDALLGGADSVLLFDESGFNKKGQSSAGVSRQWTGRLGKVDNCQVGVFATLCRGDMASIMDTRLYLPEVWANAPERCTKAAIPKEAQCYQSKTTLALRLLETAVQRGIRFGYVGIDGGYGKEPAFLRAVADFGCRFVADVHCDQAIYLQNPDPAIPSWNGRGKQPIHRKAQQASLRVDQWAASQSPTAWQKQTLREGEKGLLVAEYLHTHVWVWDGEEKEARCWHLMVRREVGATEISHYCLSNAPLEVPLHELARIQAQRFFIEHSFREAKSECGMADYQVRRWDAWHHHMSLVMLGTLFLVKQKIAGRQQWPMLSLNDLVTALAHLLPRRQLTAEELADIINQRHRLRKKAKDFHIKRQQVANE